VLRGFGRLMRPLLKAVGRLMSWTGQ
jgi:hypothetical protein